MGWLIAFGLFALSAGSFYAGARYGRSMATKAAAFENKLRVIKGQL